MITYNHEKYIAQAIESVLMQKTDFDYELIIGEDCSTDNTRSICLHYKNKYPDKIRLLLPETNLGMMQNATNTLKACKGEYIAMLEGDDYWIDPYKLQKQIDFLERNPDFAICFTNAQIKRENNANAVDEVELTCIPLPEEISTIKDLLFRNYITTSTAVLRNKLTKELLVEFANYQLGDWVLFVLIAQYGKIKYINEITSIYRLHQGGIYSPRAETFKLSLLLSTQKRFLTYFRNNKEYSSSINKGLDKCYEYLLKEYAFGEKNKLKAFQVLLKKIKDSNQSVFDIKNHIQLFRKYIL